MVGVAFQNISCDKRHLFQRGSETTGFLSKRFLLFGVNRYAISTIAE